MAGPKTEKWTARENKHEPDGLYLLVNGRVEVSDANKAPVLTERTGRPKELELELTIKDTSDPAIQTPVWKQASFTKEVQPDQYQRVRVMWQDFVAADFPVIDDSEHAALLSKQATAQNVVADKASGGKPVAKKVVKKVKTAASKVVEAVGGLAKGAKKALKKAVKKVTAGKAAAKKAAKKGAKKAAKVAKKPVKKAAKPARKAAKKAARKGKKKR